MRRSAAQSSSTCGAPARQRQPRSTGSLLDRRGAGGKLSERWRQGGLRCPSRHHVHRLPTLHLASCPPAAPTAFAATLETQSAATAVAAARAALSARAAIAAALSAPAAGSPNPTTAFAHLPVAAIQPLAASCTALPTVAARTAATTSQSAAPALAAAVAALSTRTTGASPIAPPATATAGTTLARALADRYLPRRPLRSPPRRRRPRRRHHLPVRRPPALTAAVADSPSWIGWSRPGNSFLDIWPPCGRAFLSPKGKKEVYNKKEI